MGPTLDRSIAGAIAVTDAVVLWFARPHIDTLAADLAHPHRWVAVAGTDRAAATLAQTGLWLCAAWVAAAVLSVAASRLPGVTGRLASAVAGRAVPAVLRRSIAGAVGASIFLAPLAAGAAAPARGPAPPSPTVSASVPTALTDPLAAGSWAWPTRTSPSTHADGDPVPFPVPWPHDRPRLSAPTEVVVHRGDCLWAIAAHRLGPHADAHQIAAVTRQWYEANQPTIGSDPSLLHPGQHLHEPTEKGHRS